MADKATIAFWEPPEGRRILVMSDIHGNLSYFEGLLNKLDFSARDELVIDGDFLEKGAENPESELSFVRNGQGQWQAETGSGTWTVTYQLNK